MRLAIQWIVYAAGARQLVGGSAIEALWSAIGNDGAGVGDDDRARSPSRR